MSGGGERETRRAIMPVLYKIRKKSNSCVCVCVCGWICMCLKKSFISISVNIVEVQCDENVV